MKLSVWARKQGISYKTAWRLWKSGRLPFPSEQLPTGTVILHPPSDDRPDQAALYARVSSGDQRGDLDRQLARLAEFAATKQLRVVDTIKEVGSGLNGRRRAMLRILRDPRITTVVVEHRDRLVRFGFEYIEAAMAATGRRVLVVEPGEVTDDVARDLHDVIVSLCSRLYGKRAAANKAKRALKAVTE